MSNATWQVQHAAAVAQPRQIERALLEMLDGWRRYVDAYADTFDGAKVGADGVLGGEWAAIGHALHGLLDGPTGRLDCGTVSTQIHTLLREQGVDDA